MATTTQANNRLTITLDENFSFILSKMKEVFPLLKETDLVKMAVGGFYKQNNNLFIREPDKAEEKALNDYIANPDLINHEESIKFLNKLKASTNV